MARQRCAFLMAIFAGALAFTADEAAAYSASKVFFEFRPDGRFRVHVTYTVPALKEVRESWVDFTKRKTAERFYWDLVRGADFYPPDPQAAKFEAPKTKPEPW